MTVQTRMIPPTPDDITDAWLTARLRDAGLLRDARVVAHTAEPVESQGAAGVVARIVPAYDHDEAAAPRTLVAKFASPHAPIRTLMQLMGAYAREVEFYRCFGADPGIPVPACYHAAIDPSDGSFVLLLEDMSGARIIDGPIVSIDDVEMAVRNLAPFHARWWGHPRLRELTFLRFPGSDADRAFMEQARGALAASFPAARERYGDAVSPVLVELAERLLADFHPLLQRRWRQDVDAVTLVHGDFHPGQLFFPSEAGGRFAVFDWQTVSAGSGGDDLARLIVSSLDPGQQRAHADRLIALYHTLLIEHGVRNFDLDLCRQSFQGGVITTAIINIIASVSIDPAFITAYEERGASTTDTLFSWVAAAAETYNVIAILDD